MSKQPLEPLEKRARKCSCASCEVDLTAKPTLITSTLRGRSATRTGLRAPARARVTVDFSGNKGKGLPDFLEVWLCGECLAFIASPTRAQLLAILGGRLASIGGRDDL